MKDVKKINESLVMLIAEKEDKLRAICHYLDKEVADIADGKEPGKHGRISLLDMVRLGVGDITFGRISKFLNKT